MSSFRTNYWLLRHSQILSYYQTREDNSDVYQNLLFSLDYVTDEAMKIVRLLHIRNLRDLQTQINEALVSVQKVTADPKTDQRLGKIGR